MNHQACIKHQASSICFVTNQHTTEVEALLTRQISIIFRSASFPKFEIFTFSILKHENKVWYYQSGPKSVSINPYGIPEPPKPLRNCQSLDWAQKTKKFESLKNKWEFLKSRHGCRPVFGPIGHQDVARPPRCEAQPAARQPRSSRRPLAASGGYHSSSVPLGTCRGSNRGKN